MKTFKVTNITNNLGKRHPNFDSTLNITYVDQMEKKNLQLGPKKTIYFSAASLPLSLHRFRMKSLVSISEVTEQELLKLKSEGSKKEDDNDENIKKEKKSTIKKSTTSKSNNSTKSKSSGSKKTYSKRTTTTTTTKKDGEESE